MRDATGAPLDHAATLWSPTPDFASVRIAREGWSARPARLAAQVLASGDIARAVSEIAPGAAEVGLWGTATGDPYAIRIARDRILLASDKLIAFKPGWNPSGFAATAADDSFFAVDLAGPDLNDLIAEAISADIESGSPSAAVQFAGLFALLYRIDAGAARVHVESPHATALWHWLETRPA